MTRKTMCSCFLVAFLGLLVGCASLESIRAQNREHLIRLSPGMTKSDVLQVMGTKTISDFYSDTITNPYRTELYRSAGHTFEVLLYYTDIKKADGAITDDELTPIVLLDGKLDGWGWLYWENLVRKYELRVR